MIIEKESIMGRKEAREEVFKLMYAYCLNKENDMYMLEHALQDVRVQSESEYVVSVYEGIMKDFDSLCEEIEATAKGFGLERLYKIDLAILLVATYEIKERKDIPVAVSVNEAICLAKKYSTEKSASFINGVLASIVKKYGR